MRANEGGAPGGGGRDAPGNYGEDASARCPLLLCGQVVLWSPCVFYFTWDAEMVPLVGHVKGPNWLGGE
jgi:hypothetical protein